MGGFEVEEEKIGVRRRKWKENKELKWKGKRIEGMGMRRIRVE